MIAAELVYRSWVAEGGYEWRSYQELPTPRGQAFGYEPIGLYSDYPGMVITEVSVSERRYRALEPFKNPTLYREFAAIGWGDRAAAVAFANKYGSLDANPRMGRQVPPLPAGIHIRHRNQYVPADPEEAWTIGPAMLRVLIRVWEGSPDELKSDFRWMQVGGKHTWVWYPDATERKEPTRGRPGMCLIERPIYQGLHIERYPEDGVERQLPFDPRYPWTGMEPVTEVARAFLRQELSRLIDMAVPHLKAGGFAMQLAASKDSDMAFQVIPESMFQAIFIQFAAAVAGHKDHRQCPVCGSWYELVPGDKGLKVFCSNACKVKDYRDRKARAAALKAEGKTPAQIAQLVDTPLETVKGWLKKSTRKGK